MTKKTKQNTEHLRDFQRAEIKRLALDIVCNTDYIVYESKNLLPLLVGSGIINMKEDENGERGWYASARYDGIAAYELAYSLSKSKSPITSARTKIKVPEILSKPKKTLPYSDELIHSVIINGDVRETYILNIVKYIEPKLPALIKQMQQTRQMLGLSPASIDKNPNSPNRRWRN